jgi:hypothetical protein
MSIHETRDNWKQSESYTYWRNPYKWDERICVAFLTGPHGCAELYLSFDLDATQSDDVQQEFSVDAVIGGRRLHMRQERSRRDFMTRRGAQIVAGRWLREMHEEHGQ